MAFAGYFSKPSQIEMVREDHDFEFILTDFSRVTITATTAQAALLQIRAEYGARAFREAWMVAS